VPNRRRVGSLIGSVCLLSAGCTDTDGSLHFTNDTDATVWVAYNSKGDAGFDIGMAGWTEAASGERVVYSEDGCLRFGEVVVATEPGEDAIVDRRVTSDDDPLCGSWTWSGIGDHD
jgi:hypothetical protein